MIIQPRRLFRYSSVVLIHFSNSDPISCRLVLLSRLNCFSHWVSSIWIFADDVDAAIQLDFSFIFPFLPPFSPSQLSCHAVSIVLLFLLWDLWPLPLHIELLPELVLLFFIDVFNSYPYPKCDTIYFHPFRGALLFLFTFFSRPLLLTAFQW